MQGGALCCACPVACCVCALLRCAAAPASHHALPDAPHPPLSATRSSVILERALRRLEWERVRAKEAKEQAERAEREREAMLSVGEPGRAAAAGAGAQEG